MHGTVEVHYLFSEAPEELYALPKAYATLEEVQYLVVVRF